MERRSLLPANNISIGLSFGFFTDVDRKPGFSRPPGLLLEAKNIPQRPSLPKSLLS
jgi:hypothetical protein